MSRQITLSMPEELYVQVERVAVTTRRNVADVILETISHSFEPFPVNAARFAMQKEVEAYKALHANLAKSYMGEYVAVYQGQLVDHDSDPVALHERITSKFPNKIVLSRKVQEVAEPILHMRSPRLERIP